MNMLQVVLPKLDEKNTDNMGKLKNMRLGKYLSLFVDKSIFVCFRYCLKYLLTGGV